MSEANDTTPITSMVEPFELEVSKGSFQLKVKGFKPLAQVSQYVADFVGIVGEPVGTITDTLRNYRIHRAESAAAAMLRAKQIAAEEGKRLPAVSPKMLSPWIEGASSEDLHSENILELWARLLASATAEFDPVLLAFIEICKKIGPREAKTLSSLININCFSGISCSIEGGGRRIISLDEEKKSNLRYLDRMVKKLPHDIDTLSLDPAEFSCLPLLQGRMCGKVANVSLTSGSAGRNFGGDEELMVLEFLGVVTSEDVHWQIGPQVLKCTLYEPTPLGVKFFEIIHQDELTIKDISLASENFGDQLHRHSSKLKRNKLRRAASRPG